MKITTWNINSVRIRQKIIEKFINECQPDVICLQETKVTDDKFPTDFFSQQGYKYQHFKGEKSYNGVAIISRIPFETQESLEFTQFNHKRHVSVILPGDIELHNFYIPAGGDIPDIDENPKFAHKLEYIQEATNWFREKRQSKNKIILVGDLNIAPLENDVWSHKQLLKVVSHTPIEVDHLQSLYKSINFCDAIRKFVSKEEKLFSWWSYRNKDWKKSNRGRRLDHIWVTPPVEKMLKSHQIYTNARDFEKPSDHVPVSIKIKS